MWIEMADLGSALNVCASTQLHGCTGYLHHPHCRIIVLLSKHCHRSCTRDTLPSACYKRLAFGDI